jgi:hypothetical protein
MEHMMNAQPAVDMPGFGHTRHSWDSHGTGQMNLRYCIGGKGFTIGGRWICIANTRLKKGGGGAHLPSHLD